ncbi:hypothetical protein LCGC14_0424950 [marine sediment metagenome]|uniref:Uncharacterized protein n=1 Tax=marine sediment metagenome TaxID=412755 RepID=A0A0F9VZ83_9ZZZZ
MLLRLEWIEDRDHCIECTELLHCQVCDACKGSGHIVGCEFKKLIDELTDLRELM